VETYFKKVDAPGKISQKKKGIRKKIRGMKRGGRSNTHNFLQG